MYKTLVRGLLIAALSTTALTPLYAFAKAPAVATAQMPDAAKGVDFAHNHSDITPDPTVRYGKLPNGLTYMVKKNATPPGNASVRLRINGGSLNENDDQQGLAHFIEHMAFNGSKNVAEGDMIKILERHGLSFGADTNAFTNFEQTVYELDLPKVADDDLDTALFLMRETAGNLLLDDGAIDRERGVILGEERARDTPGLHAYIKWSGAAYGDQKYALRLPIGKRDIIQTAKHDRFADFYSNFYRPEQTTLVVVGDVDPDKIEALIKTKFSDWNVSSPLRVTDYGATKPRGLRADTYTEAGVSNNISASWFSPVDESYQTEAKETKDFIDSLRFQILNDRLEKLAKLPETPFASASVGRDTVDHTAEMTELSVTPKPGKDREAFTAAYTAVRQYIEFGAGQPEIDRVLADIDSSMKAAVEGADTRNSRELAESLVDAVDHNDVPTSPQQDYAFFQALKSKLTLDTLNSGIKGPFAGDGPLLWHQAPELGNLDKAALLDAYTAVQSAKLAAADVATTKPWPYTDFGTPAKVVKRDYIKDLDLTQVTWSNGVKATIKSTTFKAKEVGITVRFAGGLQSLSPASKPPVFAADSLDLLEGGLGKLTSSEIKDSLTGKIYQVNLSMGDDAASLSGGTTTTDFATEMQVLMAFTVDPAYRADAFERLKAFIPNYYARLAASPGGVFQTKGNAILHNDDARYTMPTQAEFLATTNDQVKGLIDHQLKTGPVEVTIVGDLSVDDAVAQIEKTFATLAARATKPVIPADGATVSFPSGAKTYVLEHHGRADQDLSYIAWPGADFTSDTKRARGLSVLSEVMNLRLTEVVREQKGIAYSPFAGNVNSQVFAGYGYLSAAAEVKPENDQAFYEAVSGIVADLATKPITSDELLRAQKPLLDSMDTQLKTNSYWMSVLPGSVSQPAKLDYIRSRRAQYQAVTATDIQTLAAKYLDMKKVQRIQVKPAADATPVDPSAPAK